jgi:hypothetical protein
VILDFIPTKPRKRVAKNVLLVNTTIIQTAMMLRPAKIVSNIAVGACCWSWSIDADD